MKITEEMADYVSALSRLKLPEDERTLMAAQLEQILDYMDLLGEVDTQHEAPLSHVFPLSNVLRTDEVEPSLDRSALLASSPASDEEAFLVPKAVE